MRIRKKGSAIDFLYNATFITVLPIIFALSIYILIQLKGTAIDQEGIIDNSITALADWDEIFLVAFVLMGLVVVALASRISAHPVFLWFSYFVYAIVITIGATMSNLYLIIESDTALNAGFVYFEFVKLIHQNMPTFLVFGLFTVGFVVYSKAGLGGTRTGV